MLLDLIGAILLGFNAAIVIGTLALGLGSTLAQRLRTAAVLAGWLAIMIALGASGALHAAPTAPLDVRGAALARFGLSVSIPLAAMVLGALFVRSLRERVINMPTAALVGVNAVRILGVLFIILYAQGRLPAPFAPAAGWGDVLIGVLAIPLAFATRRSENRSLLLGWSALGLADLINAVSLGVATQAGAIPGAVSTDGMTLLPWLLIPGFLVPLFAATHLAIFYKLLSSRAPSDRPAFA
jgi:hypothetical protein